MINKINCVYPLIGESFILIRGFFYSYESAPRERVRLRTLFIRISPKNPQKIKKLQFSVKKICQTSDTFHKKTKKQL